MDLSSTRRVAAALFFCSSLFLGACGESDDGCVSFCEALGCPTASAGCDSGNQCACFGCQAYYDAHYSEATGYISTAPFCEPKE